MYRNSQDMINALYKELNNVVDKFNEILTDIETDVLNIKGNATDYLKYEDYTKEESLNDIIEMLQGLAKKLY